MAAYESDDWINNDDDFYIRDISLYELLSLPLNERALFACCICGGPIAIAKMTDELRAQWKIFIYTSHGKNIGFVETNEIFYLVWSKEQKLVVMNSEGHIFLYTPLGELLREFDLGEAFLIEQAKIFSHDNGNGLVALNKSNEIFGINSINNPASWQITGLEKRYKITSWAVISRATEPIFVVVCVQNRFFRGILAGQFSLQIFEWAFKNGAYISMEPNYDNSSIALLHDSKQVQLVTGEFSQVLHLLQMSTISPIQWCGKDLIFAVKNSTDLEFCVIKSKKLIAINSSRPIWIGVDNDAVRVFTQSSCHIITQVPASMVEALKLNCISSPTALLYDACKRLNDNEHLNCDAYTYIKMIDSQMSQAVFNCIDAAANHFNPPTQMKFLKAAEMGISFCNEYDRSTYADVILKLRILNTLRRFGFPLTFQQIQELSILGVIDRLMALHEWSLAISLYKFVNLEDENEVCVVLTHWCSWVMDLLKKRIEKNGSEISENDEKMLANKILNRLESFKHINYADIAMMATLKKLKRTAYFLLERESDTSRHIHVLLKLNDNKKALQEAIKSQQPDLLHMVLNHVKKKGDHLSSEFQSLLKKNPQAFALYQSHVHDSTPDRALDLYKQNEDFLRLAICELKRARQSSDDFDTVKMVEQLRAAGESLRHIGAALHLVDQSIHLINENAKLEEKFSTSMTNKTVRETFIFAVTKNEMALVESLRKHHKLTDTQYWLWMIEGFAQGQRWQQLEQFGRSRKSPIGFLKLIEACCRHGNPNLAERFFDKLVSVDDQIKAKTLIGDFVGAAKLAAQSKDVATLQRLKKRFPQISEIIP